MSLTLSEPELADLTHLRRPRARARWLERHDIAYAVRADGSLAVSREAVLRALGALAPAGGRAAPSREAPDWSALDAAAPPKP